MTPNNQAFKHFVIVPNGHITGGNCQYSADPDTGIITYGYSISVSLLFFSHTFADQGTIRVNPEQLKSKNLGIGQKLNVGPVAIEVRNITKGKAICSLSIEDQGIDEVGDLVLDVSQENLSLVSLSTEGEVRGFDIKLQTAVA